ncbi:MAG: hypothetical protein IT172_02055 [Acidobacteria bacterium]|nr:hypothetical protein [Acidobacteriota bacterium]
MPISEMDSLPSFSAEKYLGIAMNDLVIYAVFVLSQYGKEIIEADIVAICFLMFPRRFELRGYPQWPDSSVILRRWLDCRSKGLITGSTKDGFSLTPKGVRSAESVAARLESNQVAKPKVRSELRTRAGRFVREIENSIAYRTFERSGAANVEIAEYDFRGMLMCTMESSASTLRSNLQQFKEYVSVYDRTDLITFLEQMEQRFADILAQNTSSEYERRMVRRRVKK